MTAPNVYDPGTQVRIIDTIVDGLGAPFDPDEVIYHYTDNQGNDTTEAYNDSDVVSRLNVGIYQLLINVPYTNDSVGEWTYDRVAKDGDGVELHTTDGRFVVKRLATLE